MEYKDFMTEVKELNEKGEGILRFIHFYQEDKDSDITLPGFIGRQEAILISSHNWKSDEPPLGRGESFETDVGTHFRFKLNMQDPRAQRWYSWLKMDQSAARPLQQISYGFSPFPDAQERKQEQGRQVRYLKPRPDGSVGAKLHELSFVTVGSGNDQGVLALKESALAADASAHVNPEVSQEARSMQQDEHTAEQSAKGHVEEAMSAMRAGKRAIGVLREQTPEPGEPITHASDALERALTHCHEAMTLMDGGKSWTQVQDGISLEELIRFSDHFIAKADQLLFLEDIRGRRGKTLNEEVKALASRLAEKVEQLCVKLKFDLKTRPLISEEIAARHQVWQTAVQGQEAQAQAQETAEIDALVQRNRARQARLEAWRTAG